MPFQESGTCCYHDIICIVEGPPRRQASHIVCCCRISTFNRGVTHLQIARKHARTLLPPIFPGTCCRETQTSPEQSEKREWGSWYRPYSTQILSRTHNDERRLFFLCIISLLHQPAQDTIIISTTFTLLAAARDFLFPTAREEGSGSFVLEFNISWCGVQEEQVRE